MKRFAVIAASLFWLCGCSLNGNSSVSSSVTEVTEIQTTEAQTTETSITTTKTTTNTVVTTVGSVTTTISTPETTVAVHETIERKIKVDEDVFKAIECVQNEYDSEPYTIFDGTNYIVYDNEICFFADEVSKVQNDTLGEITGEDDLIAKAREVFIEVVGQDYINMAEAEYIDKNGEKFAIAERTTPVYYTNYYAEYDVWYINPCMPSGVTEDGKSFFTIQDNPPFLIIYGNSGKIIGCRF